MCHTRHIQKTLSQAELRSRMAGLLSALVPAECLENGHLSPAECKKILKELKSMQKTVQKIAKSGGCVVVSRQDQDITTYRVDSYMSHR